ncbi:MAG: stage III sporulation protein AG [Butyrivibrio sp.]|nr:stage III sporulation protein AG [Acetatifactor muris]MCM1560636.1 stage III sporulation protein AG [Butyrivibrio sp.]
MKKEGKKWLEDERVKKLFRRDNLLVLILAGILLFVIALPTKEGSEKSGGAQGEKENVLYSPETGTAGAAEGGQTAPETAAEAGYPEYAATLEKRLTEALADMADVGKVRVMITLKSSGELVVERETPVSRSVTTETDAQGGTRTVNTSETGESVVYSTEGSSSTPYVVKTYAPEIEGVLVVAEGAGSGTVNRTVTEIVQALFHIDAHKVKVVKMETKSK